ncbi:protein phosphatase 2C domain-containing protein [Streptomyces sp. NPDC050418]|uniref:protein phosphatase 2C domain-containing protein n=1 Tax=Streptomyces sp. NPDC050418 TaxID=3365612 RepID=UPI003795330A
MSQQGDRRQDATGHGDDWWDELYGDFADDTGRSSDSLDDRFESAADTVIEEPPPAPGERTTQLRGGAQSDPPPRDDPRAPAAPDTGSATGSAAPEDAPPSGASAPRSSWPPLGDRSPYAAPGTEPRRPDELPSRTDSSAPGELPSRTDSFAAGERPSRTDPPAPGELPSRTDSFAAGERPSRTDPPAPGELPSRTAPMAPGELPPRTAPSTPGEPPSHADREPAPTREPRPYVDAALPPLPDTPPTADPPRPSGTPLPPDPPRTVDAPRAPDAPDSAAVPLPPDEPPAAPAPALPGDPPPPALPPRPRTWTPPPRTRVPEPAGTADEALVPASERADAPEPARAEPVRTSKGTPAPHERDLSTPPAAELPSDQPSASGPKHAGAADLGELAPRVVAQPTYVGDGPPTYDAEPATLPPADPDELTDLVADTVLDGARYGTYTLRATSVRGDSARYRGEVRRDSLLTARFGSGDSALLLVAMATGARATPGAHLAAAEVCHWIGRAVGRSHGRLAEDIRAARRGDLKSGLHRLTDRSLGKLRAGAAERGLEPDEYTVTSLRCLLLPADPDCRTRVFFGVGGGGLFRLRDGEWQDIEPKIADAAGEPLLSFGSVPSETPDGDRLTMDLQITTPPSPYDEPPGPPREPFRFRASVARPGDTLLLCSGGLAEPLRGEPALAGLLRERWSESGPPGLAGYLADIQLRVKGYADDRTAAAVWET